MSRYLCDCSGSKYDGALEHDHGAMPVVISISMAFPSLGTHLSRSSPTTTPTNARPAGRRES